MMDSTSLILCGYILLQNQNNMSMGFKKDSPSSVTSNSAMISSTTSAPPGSTSPVYANTAASNYDNNNQTYAQVRAKASADRRFL